MGIWVQAKLGDNVLTTYEEPDVRQALALASRLVDASGLVVVAGSLYIVGTARADVLDDDGAWARAGAGH